MQQTKNVGDVYATMKKEFSGIIEQLPAISINIKDIEYLGTMAG